jgi:hypothetical protein
MADVQSKTNIAEITDGIRKELLSKGGLSAEILDLLDRYISAKLAAAFADFNASVVDQVTRAANARQSRIPASSRF